MARVNVIKLFCCRDLVCLTLAHLSSLALRRYVVHKHWPKLLRHARVKRSSLFAQSITKEN
jgi:hypothetical protein